MKKTIYSNILSLAFMTVLVISAIFVAAFNQEMHAQRAEEIRAEAVSIASACEMEEDKVSFLNGLKSDGQHRISLISAEGTVLYDSQVEAESLENHLERPEIQKARQNGVGSESRLSNTLQEETYYYAVRMSDGSFLRISIVNGSVFKTFLDIFPLMLLVAVVIFFCALFVARRVVKRISLRINEIDLKHPMEKIPFQELEPLLRRIEKQNKQISEQMGDLLEQEHKFHTITENMNEGLILLDTSSKIVFINQSCKNLFDMSGIQLVGKHISLFHRSDEIQQVIASSLQGNGCNRTLDLREKQVQFFGNPVVENGTITGVVLFVLDITEKQKAERLRKEFSANVSHELKTPLTSISGYAELMQNGLVAAADIPSFAGKIYEEAARLLTLVNDIIKISRLDEGNVNQNKELVDLYSVAEEVVSRLVPVAQKQEVSVHLEGSHVNLRTIRQLMYDMIYNLCENGIKYNVSGGSVTVQVLEEDGRPLVSVSDTGIGIPMEYQERIFERFYRIDKSHSKQTGGTGLGLSIVKHVVEYQGGYIDIHSNQEEGTTIKIHL